MLLERLRLSRMCVCRGIHMIHPNRSIFGSSVAGVLILAAGSGCSTSEVGPCGLSDPVLSADGTRLAFTQTFCNNTFISVAGDSLLVSSARDARVLHRDLQTGQTIAAFDAAPSAFDCSFGFCSYVMSPDGIHFASGSVSGSQIAVFNIVTGQAELFVIEVDDGSTGDIAEVFASEFSANGDFLALGVVFSFSEFDYTLRSYLLNLESGDLETIAVNDAGSPANGSSFGPILSSDAQFVAFVSEADNLVENDGNGLPDVFVRDRQASRTERVSVASDGSEAVVSGLTYQPEVVALSISADGRFVLFIHPAANLAGDDVQAPDDSDRAFGFLYLRDRQEKQTTLISAYDSQFAGLSDDGRLLNPLSPHSFLAFTRYQYVMFHLPALSSALVSVCQALTPWHDDVFVELVHRYKRYSPAMETWFHETRTSPTTPQFEAETPVGAEGVRHTVSRHS